MKKAYFSYFMLALLFQGFLVNVFMFYRVGVQQGNKHISGEETPRVKISIENKPK